MYKIYVVEDEQNLNQVIRAYLEKEGYEVKTFTDGLDAQIAIKEQPSLWVLDIMLPNVSGFDLLKEIKATNEETPIIFISARDTDIDRILGLELGCDDYLNKPFSPKELVLRIQKILKRIHTNTNDQMIRYGNYSINSVKRSVYLNNEMLDLTTKEYDLLILFLQNINNALQRDQIIDAVWNNDYFGSARAADDLVRRLRKKMPDLKIEALYGFGYRLI